MRRLFFAIFLLSTLYFLPLNTQAATVDLYFFYGQGCPHCAKMEVFLDEMEAKYPNLEVMRYETYFNEENRNLFFEMANEFGVEVGGVPTSFIDGKVFTGFSDSIAELVEAEIVRLQNLDEKTGSEPATALTELVQPKQEEEEEEKTVSITTESSPSANPAHTELLEQITVPAVLSAAAVDAINPCAFAVLIILMTTILASKSRRRSLAAGLAFSASIFISYLLMGIGLYSAIAVSGLGHTFYVIVAILAILLGLFNLKDSLWYGKWFVMEVPMSWRPKLKSIIRGVTSIPGAFLIGFVVSLFLLPCTSGPYIVILGLLSSVTTRNTAFLYLVLYNLIFILPMILITLAIFFGITTTEKAEAWRQGRLKTLHLIAGLILLLLGIGMFVAIGLGMI